MIDRLPAVGFYARGETQWRSLLRDTAAALFGVGPESIPAAVRHWPGLRSIVQEEFRILSYVMDWKEAFAESPLLDIEWCNVNNLIEFEAGLRKLKRYPLSVVLHSAAWDDLRLLRMAQGRFQDRRGTLLLFYGNEYHNMQEKIDFARSVSADYIASQLPLSSAQWLYATCEASTILPAPPALNPRVYRSECAARPIDIGFRGDLYISAYALGDTERTDILQYFDRHAEAWGLTKDIAFVRHPRDQWNEFLNRCKGIMGAESGTYYLERDDRTRQAVIDFLSREPTATFSDVYERFFRSYANPVSGKAISSRHFEPIGTKTCQLLLEGDYNGILKADEHYIGIKKDFSNISDAIRRFKDPAYRQGITARAFEHVLAAHTYAHRVAGLLQEVLAGCREVNPSPVWRGAA
ncbi:MAG TPA: glycosyltransferase [Nitrospiraceae bacterium]|nr:glycosyltransferase [Nitrospiraceae bacterium]